MKFVTGPAKTGDVGTNYILSHNRSSLRTAKEYLCSVTCTIKPIKYLIRMQIFMAMNDQKKSYMSHEIFKKQSNFMC